MNLNFTGVADQSSFFILKDDASFNNEIGNLSLIQKENYDDLNQS
jgi:hypothetical protein